MINQRIIDRLWPVGGVHKELIVPSRLEGPCLKCGRCCALIRISADYEYFIEKMKHCIDDAESSGEPLSKQVLEWWREAGIIIRHWVRVDRWEAVRRGFREQVEPTDFFYTCKLLNSNGTCRAHNRFRPNVCTGYPHYGKTKRKELGPVFRGCGYADQRYKTGKYQRKDMLSVSKKRKD